MNSIDKNYSIYPNCNYMKKLLIAISSCLIFSPIIKAQFSYSAASASSSLQTYNDLGTLGTAITKNFQGNSIGFYRDNSSIQNIGFNFKFNGTNYTQFVLSSSGYIKLGNTAPSKGQTNPFNNETNVIYPLSTSALTASTFPEYRVLTSGEIGARICTIQFKGLTDTSTTAGYVKQFSSLEYQLKLYESSNKIEFVYGNFIPTGNAGVNYLYAIGIKGNDFLSFVNSIGKSTNWVNDNFIDTFLVFGNVKNLNVRSYPSTGLTYSFDTTKLPAFDSKVQIVYTLSKILANDPHQIKAIIRNNGTSPMINLPVTLSVTGANVFTDVQNIASLAAGSTATVTFISFTPINLGDNTISVSVPADDVYENNEVLKNQTVTAGTVNNMYGVKSTYGSVSSSAGKEVAILVENKGAKIIDSIKAYTFYSKYVGKAFLVKLYTYTANGPSTELWKSDTLLSELNYNYIPVPNISVNGKFFVIITQPAASGYSISYEMEFPLRDSMFYERFAINTGKWILERGQTTSANYSKYVAEVHYSTILPIKLSDFNVNQEDQIATLHFSTGDEESLSKIEIERSANGSDWDRLISLVAKGNATTNSYQYADAGLSNGKWYYRLKMVEKDGTITYSKIVNAEIVDSRHKIVVAPNPTTDKLMVMGNHIAFIQVKDNQGKLLQSQVLKDANNPTLSVVGLLAGVYYIRVQTTDGKIKNLSFVKQ